MPLAFCSFLTTETSKMEVVETTTDTPSLFYSVLPLSVQRRIPKLGSLRRRAGDYARPTRAEPDSSTSDCSDDSATLVPSYRSSGPASGCESDDEGQLSSPLKQSTGRGGATAAHVDQKGGGVKWKYASQGATLLSLATQEADSPSHHSLLSRRMYIDSVGYLLQGLPVDLTKQEEASLWYSLPPSLATMPFADNQPVDRMGHDQDCPDPSAMVSDPSVLHRAVACLTLYVLLLVYSILPYIQLLLQHAYQYDRKHKISHRLFAKGASTVDLLGKQTLLLAVTVCAMNGGKVGEAMKDVGTWWVQGVSGGVYDGVGEGMHVLGLRPTTRRQTFVHREGADHD